MYLGQYCIKWRCENKQTMWRRSLNCSSPYFQVLLNPNFTVFDSQSPSQSFGFDHSIDLSEKALKTKRQAQSVTRQWT